MINGKRRIVTNLGYILYWKPSHNRAEKSGAFKGYVYEHVLVAEKNLERKLYAAEVVHHLDFDRANNTPTNLLVLLDSEHRRLHQWLSNQGFERKVIQLDYSANQSRQFLKRSNRCPVCKWPFLEKEGVCSVSCLQKKQQTADEKKREILQRLIKEGNPWTHIGPAVGLSDNGARHLARRLGLLPKKS